MMIITWSDHAAADMDDIYDFYLLKSPRIAGKIYNSILKEVDILKRHPQIAAIEPLLQDEEFVFRSLVTKDGLFKIIYSMCRACSTQSNITTLLMHTRKCWCAHEKKLVCTRDISCVHKTNRAFGTKNHPQRFLFDSKNELKALLYSF